MNPTLAPRQQITGLVLAGGRGSRMGGVDKGLQTHRGVPLAQHALQRLAPQVGPLMLNANRNIEAYAAMGAPVWPDALPDYPGPLAGMLAGLDHCDTPWLVTVPCDAPLFPLDLVERLAAAAQAAGADIAMPVTTEDGHAQIQPVFLLMRAELRESLSAFTQAGEAKIARWARQHRLAEVPFGEPRAFFNANTLADLARLAAAGDA